MPQNVINLYERFSFLPYAFSSEKDIENFVNELNNSKNKGIVLKRWGFLEKGERWKWEDLDRFMEKNGYVRDKNNIYNKETNTVKELVEEMKNVADEYLENEIVGNLYRMNNEYCKYGEFGEIYKAMSIVTYADKKYVIFNDINEMVPIEDFNNCFDLLTDDEAAEIIDYHISITKDKYAKKILEEIRNKIGKEEIKFNTRTELIAEFKRLMPFMIDKEIRIKYHKMPKYKKVYKQFKKQGLPDTAKEFEHLVRYGEERTMKGYLIIQEGCVFKTRHGYLLVKDIEDNDIEKPIIIENLIEFEFNNKIYKLN